MGSPSKKDGGEGNRTVIEMSKFIAVMVCNTTNIEKTGKPLTDDEFDCLYRTLPDTVRIEIENEENEISEAEKKQIQKLVGNSGSFRAKAREKGYDEVRVVLSLDSEGKVSAFNKSPMLWCGKTPVKKSEFTAPESADPNNEVYSYILGEMGEFAVYSENQAVSIDGGGRSSKTSKISSKHGRTSDGKVEKITSLESIVPLECRSLFMPCKASAFTFVGGNNQEIVENYTSSMLDKYGYTKEQSLIQLLGLYGQVSQKDVDTMLEVLESDEVTVEQVESYQKVVAALLSCMCDDGYKVEAPINADGTFDMEAAVLELARHNKAFNTLLTEGKNAMITDNYTKVLIESQPEKVLLSIISNYIPMVITDFADLGPSANIEFIWSLMGLIGGQTSNSVVSVTVKDTDVVQIGR